MMILDRSKIMKRDRFYILGGLRRKTGSRFYILNPLEAASGSPDIQDPDRTRIAKIFCRKRRVSPLRDVAAAWTRSYVLCDKADAHRRTVLDLNIASGTTSVMDSKFDYQRAFAAAVDQVKAEGRYRVFADLKRI